MEVPVESISFYRGEAGFCDQFDECLAGEVLTRVGSGCMGNPLLNNRPVQVVGPEIEGKLGDLQSEHDPEGLYVEKIVEEQP